MAVIISNCNGCFALFGIASRYQGVFFSGSRVFKTIAGFESYDKNESDKKFTYNLCNAENKNKKAWFAYRLPVFFYESKNESIVLLDCKDDYDNRVWGRYYDVSVKDNTLIVHYQKKNDKREESTDEYDFWLAFHGSNFRIINEWIEENYSFDRVRQSHPFSRFVFRAFNVSGSFACAFAESRWDAVKLARDSWNNRIALANEAEQYAEKVVKAGLLPVAKISQAVKFARYSLACMQASNGLYAGLPWFHQRWARDELISLSAIFDSKTLSKSVLFYWLNNLQGCQLKGTLTETIADSGWLFVRFEEFWQNLNRREKNAVIEKLKRYYSEVEKSLQEGLVISGFKQTWMDSISREGARIEIQALTLAAFRLLRAKGRPSKRELKLKKQVRNSFWTGSYLKDGSNDATIRPNIFIAAYVYPELLSKIEWQKCFDTVLPKLWLDWGGLSTLDKTSSDFVANHTGENPKSYHQGDSWYWINNLAALVLSRFNKRKYKKYIDVILTASTKEILRQGAIGHHAEVSSAEIMTSSGCLAQLWSAAMYVELVEEVYGKK